MRAARIHMPLRSCRQYMALGFSIAEASLAKRVTVVGGVQAFPDSILETLRNAGCAVERMIVDGTVLAT